MVQSMSGQPVEDLVVVVLHIQMAQQAITKIPVAGPEVAILEAVHLITVQIILEEVEAHIILETIKTIKMVKIQDTAMYIYYQLD